jgi:enamine deaminase RidA (YjgF/YER057c/UK114 family)
MKQRLAILFALSGLLAGTAVAQTQQASARPSPQEKSTQVKPDTTIRRINPPALTKPNGYAQLVTATGARTIYLAGQTPIDKDGKIVGPGDFRAQAKQAFENVKAALAAAGVGFGQVVRINYYVLDMGNAPALREIRSTYLGSDIPASTLLEVRKLARDEYMIEIEATAVSAK